MYSHRETGRIRNAFIIIINEIYPFSCNRDTEPRSQQSLRAALDYFFPGGTVSWYSLINSKDWQYQAYK